jgi:AAA domain
LRSIDNFQGEEAHVVILSLVRNNPEQNILESGKRPKHAAGIGFVALQNRVNVLISRAKHGLYILGHKKSFQTATVKGGTGQPRQPSMWKNVLKKLEEGNAVHEHIPIYCQKHKDTVNMIKVADDFDMKAKEGGCMRLCGFRIKKCGHACQRLCHHDDP